jgi:hypothetical protein
LLLVVAVAACGDNAGPNPWLIDAHILVDGYNETNTNCRTELCAHDENTDLAIYDGATYLVHRTALSQILGPNSSLRVSRSDDHGATWTLLAVIPAPLDRDLRDPSFFEIDGQLAIKAITRLPVASTRDSDVDSISVVTTSPDGGTTWTSLAPAGPPTWSFWRVRDFGGVHYSAAYEDGDKSIELFASPDGRTWTPGAVMYAVAEDTPVETELVFADSGDLTAYVRMDGLDNEILGSQGRLRTKVCTAAPPYATFACDRELTDVRLDGPVAFEHDGRLFMIARKHFLEVANRKRTALYELTADGGVVERGEFPSAGDTSYAGVAPISGDRFLVTYYSSNVIDDEPWARAMFGPTDIWQATIDVSLVPR